MLFPVSEALKKDRKSRGDEEEINIAGVNWREWEERKFKTENLFLAFIKFN